MKVYLDYKFELIRDKGGVGYSTDFDILQIFKRVKCIYNHKRGKKWSPCPSFPVLPLLWPPLELYQPTESLGRPRPEQDFPPATQASIHGCNMPQGTFVAACVPVPSLQDCMWLCCKRSWRLCYRNDILNFLRIPLLGASSGFCMITFT